MLRLGEGESEGGGWGGAKVGAAHFTLFDQYR